MQKVFGQILDLFSKYSAGINCLLIYHYCPVIIFDLNALIFSSNDELDPAISFADHQFR